MHIFEKNINDLNLKIGEMLPPVANYVPYVLVDNILYVSGQAPIIDGKIMYSGKVGEDLTEEQGIKAAELCCVNIISALKSSINSDWDRGITSINQYMDIWINIHFWIVFISSIINSANRVH